MPINLLLLSIVGVLLALLCLLSLLQLFSHAKSRRSSEQFAEKLTQLATQHQTTEQQLRENLLINLNRLQQFLSEKLSQSRLEHEQAFANHRSRFDERQMETLKILQDTLQKGVQENRTQVKRCQSSKSNSLGSSAK